jgi:hypothetical protein
MSYDCRKLDLSVETKIWADYTFWYKSGFWQTFAMTFPDTLHIKNSLNEHTFPLVTHTAYSDARFDSYAFLKSGQGDKQILDRLDRRMNN